MGHLPSSLRQTLRAFRKDGSVEVYERVDLRAWTSLGVGGYGDLLIRCSTASSVQQILDLLASHGVRWLVIGAGSRVVAPDCGFRVPLLNLTGDLGRWHVEKAAAEAGAGAKLAQVSGSVARAGLLGMENLVRAPGSVGGAVRSSVARGPGRFHDLLEWIELVRPGFDRARIELGEHGTPSWPQVDWDRAVVSRVRFQLATDRGRGRHAAGAAARLVAGHRLRVGAFVFHDPPGATAADLLERSGCASLRSGGARVSEHNANAIVATRVCSASDVIQLCRTMRDQVRDRSGVALEPRLRFLDEQGRTVEIDP